MGDAMLARRRTDDEGAILILALLFILVISLLTTSVLFRSTVGIKNVNVERGFVSKRYAAEAGLEYAIQQLRLRSNLCPSSPTINGNRLQPSDLLGSNGNTAQVNNPYPSVAISCTVTSNNDVGVNGYGLITRDTSAAGLTVTGAAGEYLKIDGPVFLGDLEDPLRFDVTNGDVIADQAGTCPTPASITLKVAAPYSLICTTDTPPDPVVTLPTVDLTAQNQTAAKKWNKNKCSAFAPGYYKKIDLNDNNYFASGVYYFEDVDLTLTAASLTGGAPSSDEAKTTSASCLRDDDSAASDIDVTGASGTGVKFILGGTSRLIADNPKGVVELFGRKGTVAGAAGEGTQGVSFMTVRSTVTNAAGFKFKQSSLGYGDVVLGVSNTTGGGGSKLELVMHGAVDAPDALVKVRNNKANTQFLAGIVAGQLDISTSANVSGFNVGIHTTPQPRDLKIVSVAGGSGERTITATATVRIDSGLNTLQVLSRSVD